MKPYFVKTPNFIKSIFQNWIWTNPSDEKVIYLTFDDGPTLEITNWTLNVLRKYQAQATFFCIGKNIVEHPEIYHEIIESGHAIGNHTYNHLNGWKTNTTPYLENVVKCQNLIENYSLLGSNNTKLFRPPYGKISLTQARKIRMKGYKIIMWDVLSADFDKATSREKCLQNVLKNSGNGSIIVFHDSFKAYENLQYSLPKVLDFFNAKGYKFKKLN